MQENENPGQSFKTFRVFFEVKRPSAKKSELIINLCQKKFATNHRKS